MTVMGADLTTDLTNEQADPADAPGLRRNELRKASVVAPGAPAAPFGATGIVARPVSGRAR